MAMISVFLNADTQNVGIFKQIGVHRLEILL